ncbi:histidine kinase dimerization/phosphoacceptor domain -containing protein [Flavihumibacter petaseus]|uniref:histidine kinase n=1 Tax=Flavihumibacter petaseus NBRC 106054 TaxID=1220578 RepID=A0A0E9N6V2_9BACT|nr:histidine kinase dimerization/phosphoacceptor domain -containing protein [Flavihumibacter petaseus]GAO45421.1 putative two-component histidine kinase [Flavihumibacter petaseus NBRC 106054]
MRTAITIQLLLALSATGLCAQQGSTYNTADIDKTLQIAKTLIFKKGEDPTDLDSSIRLLTKVETQAKLVGDEKQLGVTYLLRSQAFRELKQPQSGKVFADSAIAIFARTRSVNQTGHSYIELAQYYNAFNPNELAQKIVYYENAREYFLLSRDTLNAANTYKVIGELYGMKHDIATAISMLSKALELGKPLRGFDLQGTYDLLGDHYTTNGNLLEGIRYGLLAVKTAELQRDSSQLSTLYNRLGTTYLELDQFENADDYFQKSLAIAISHRDTTSIYILATNIGINYVLMNKGRETLNLMNSITRKYPRPPNQMINRLYMSGYILVNQPDSAKKYYQYLSKALSELSATDPTRRALEGPIIKYLIATKQIDLAYQHLSSYYEMRKSSPSAIADRQYHLWSFQADSMSGKFASAVRHYQHYKNISDSLFNSTKNNLVEQLKVEYETGKKDMELQSRQENIQLLVQQSHSQQKLIRQERLIRNMIVFISFALLLLLIIAYNRYRFKKRSNILLERQQQEINRKNKTLEKLVGEKEWLMKEIHHRVKNNLQTVIGLLNVQIAHLKYNDMKDVLRSSQNRITAMALIHQKLYQAGNSTETYMPSYIYELVEHLRDIYGVKGKISFDLRIDKVYLNVALAVPVGLIINESVTNAIKYAFPGNRPGTIRIYFMNNNETCSLSIADNGCGICFQNETLQDNTLGFQLMKGLAKEIGTALEVVTDAGQGTSVAIHFVPGAELTNIEEYAGENSDR